MLMPEAAVNKDCFATADEGEVRFPRKILSMKPESVAECIN
jgi:hypothetical protein